MEDAPPETRALDGHAIAARRQQRDGVVAVFIAFRIAGRVGPLVAHNHLRLWDHRAGRIRDGAGDGAGGTAGHEWQRHQKYE